MKSIVFTNKRQAAIQMNVEAPPPPGTDEIQVRTLACGICQQEIKQFQGHLGQTFPAERLGHESVGIVGPPDLREHRTFCNASA